MVVLFFKRIEINMKRIFLSFIMSCLIFSVLSGQTLTDQIEYAYSSLDSASYIDNIILSYARSLDKLNKKTYKIYLEMFSSNVARKQNIADSLYSKYSKNDKNLDVKAIKEFKNEVKAGMPIYVLNLKLKDERTLQVDTAKLCFNLFLFRQEI